MLIRGNKVRHDAGKPGKPWVIILDALWISVEGPHSDLVKLFDSILDETGGDCDDVFSEVAVGCDRQRWSSAVRHCIPQ